MAVGPPVEPDEPSNRWPWLALALGVLIIAVAAGVFFVNRQNTVNVTLQATPTAAPLAAAASPTVAPPTLAPTATPAQTPTAVPTPTPAPAATAAPTPTQPTQPSTSTPPTPAAPAATQPSADQAAAPPPPAAQPSQPATASAGQPTPASATTTSTPTQLPSPSPAATATPTPFAGQVASTGGLGNTRSDLDAAYGAAVGETPEHLIVYRKNNFEYHAGLAPDPTGRVALLVEMPQSGTNASPFTTDSAAVEAHKLLPKDVQPPNAQPEGSDQWIVERYTSPGLAQALPASAFTANKGQPGQLLVVYVRDPAQPARIARFIVGAGSDPQSLVNAGK